MKSKNFYNPYTSSFEEKVIALLALLKEPTAEEITGELVELHAIASEEGVAECTFRVKEVLNRLITTGKVQPAYIDEKNRYKLNL